MNKVGRILLRPAGFGNSDEDAELTIVDTSRHDESRPDLRAADLVVVPLIPCAPDMRATSTFLREVPPEFLARTAVLPNMVSWSRYGEKPLNAHGEALAELDALSAELGMCQHRFQIGQFHRFGLDTWNDLRSSPERNASGGRKAKTSSQTQPTEPEDSSEIRTST